MTNEATGTDTAQTAAQIGTATPRRRERKTAPAADTTSADTTSALAPTTAPTPRVRKTSTNGGTAETVVATTKTADFLKSLRSKLIAVPTDEVVIDTGFNPRVDFSDDKQFLDVMRTSARITPLYVYYGTDKKYHLVDGERRLRAAKAIGWKEIPAFVVTPKAEQERLIIALTSNEAKPLLPLEEAIAYRRLRTDVKSEDGKTVITPGLSVIQVAEKVGRSRVHVHNRLKLLDAAPEVLKQIEAGRLSPTLAGKIARSTKDVAAQSEAARKAASGKKGRKAVQDATKPKSAKVVAAAIAAKSAEQMAVEMKKLNAQRAKKGEAEIGGDTPAMKAFVDKVAATRFAFALGQREAMNSLIRRTTVKK